MNKILLALTLLGAGAGGFLTARQSTTQLQHEVKETREAWLVQTQLVAVAQSDQAGLSNRVRELKQALAQPQAVGESAVWSALQTNRAGHLTPELRDSLREELGFNWTSSPDFIVVSKETVRDIHMAVIGGDGKLTDSAAAVLALTPGERSQVEAAVQRVRTDGRDWASSHIERTEPKDDVVAQYTLPGDPALAQSLSNKVATAVFDALGRERAELIVPSAEGWMSQSTGIYATKPTIMTVKRYQAGNEPRLKVQIHWHDGAIQSSDLWQGPRCDLAVPGVFRPIFPDGWDDVAKREGFELPEKSQEK
ncbi:MAG: hypothetical protein ABSG78_23910 [Verrucomicrobiota bacterium]|jgi:hypothetical protein